MRFPLAFASLALVLLASVLPASAQIRNATRRVRFDQPGDITFAANSIMTCRDGTTSAGQLCQNARMNAASDRIDNDYPMVPIDADGDASTFDSSSSDLVLPAGATVTWAGLYWQCITSGGGSTPAPAPAQRNQVRFRVPGGTYQTVTAGVLNDSGSIYQGFADVTSIVGPAGAGTYWTANVQCDSGANNHYGGWSLVVAYRDDAQPLRNLVVYDAWQTYDNAPPMTITITGFVTPPTGPVRSRVGVVFYDGDRRFSDTLTLTSGARVTQLGSPPGPGVVNPNNDIGNGTITRFDLNVTTRQPAYVNTLGFDADYIATVDALPNSATTATITGVTGSEFIGFGVVTFATDIFAPDIEIDKSVVDLNGDTLQVGDVIEYTIVASNNGDDPALDVLLRDAIPAGTTYEPGSIRVAGAGRTDAAGDDTAEYDGANDRIVVRLGTGATAVAGGRMDIGATVTLTFRVRVDASTLGGEPIRNTAIVTYTGLTLGTSTMFMDDSDGDSVTPGEQPTVITTAPICGDGRTSAPESCDDGGTAPGDGCSALCRTEVSITSPDGTTTADDTPAITGRADAGAMVTVSVDGTVIGIATADASGDWTLTPTIPLAEGTHTLTATATDSLSQMSTDTAMVTIDTRTSVIITTPAEGSSTSDTTPAIRGTGEPGASVAVSIDMVAIGTVTVAADGSWSIDAPAPLSMGPHSVKADATDALGNTASTTNNFTVDLSTMVTLDSPADGSTITTRTPAYSGTGEPGAMVTVSVDGTAVGTATVASDGTWTLTGSTPLGNGAHTATVTATDPAGNTASDSSTFTVDAGTFVDIASPAEGAITRDTTPSISGTSEPGSTVTVTIDGTAVGTVTAASDGTWSIDVGTALAEGAHTIAATATDAGGETAMDTQSFTVDSMTTVDFRQPGDHGPIGETQPELSGTAEPGASVEITLDGAPAGTVIADAEGNWTFRPAMPLADRSHGVSVTATDPAGNTATDAGSFTIDTNAPSLEIRDPGDNTHTSDATPTITGDTDPGLSVIVIVDGRMVGTAIADELGHWSLDLTTPLADGPHTVEATTTDAAGNRATDAHDFIVDTTSPAVAIDAPADGSATSDTTPAISGTADPGATVQVFVDGELIGTVTAAGDGTWSLPTSDPLADGTHTVRAVAEDGAGNTATSTGSFTVDTVTTVVIATPADGSTIGAPRPAITGTAEPGASVEVSVDGSVIGTVTAGSDGRWSITPADPLSGGSHTVDARATDPLGNEATDTSTFTVDTSMLDTDGDGIPDLDECPTMPCRDSDMDGDPDFDDPDDDGDGIPTVVECSTRPCVDSDMDGMPDYLDPDDDNDGRPTRDEAPGGTTRDTDRDGAPDHLDPDDDGDGLPTVEECAAAPCRDSDTDGTPDFLDPDDDGDAIPTARERADGMIHGDDVDEDGMPNWLDTESDGDGIPDTEEGIPDRDGDGVPDYLDPATVLPDGGTADAGTGPADAGPADAGDGSAGPVAPGGFSGGACGCSVPGTGSRAPLALIFGLLGLLGLLRRRRRHLAYLAPILLFATPAYAQEGFTLNQFHLAESATDGFAISRPNDLGHLEPSVRLSADYVHDPLVYETRLGDPSTQSTRIVEHLLTGQLALAFGLFDRVVIFAGLPVSLFSQGDGAPGFPSADGTAVGDPYFGVRVRLFGEASDPFALGLQLGGTAPLGDAVQGSQAFSGERNFTFVPRINAEVRPHERLRIALNVGARIRESSQLFNLTVGHELTYGLGVTLVAVPNVLDLLVEAYGATAFESFFTREQTPLELIGGLRVQPVCGFRIGAAAGTGLVRGYGAGNFHGVFELAYAHEARCEERMPEAEPEPAPPGDRDEDGLLDNVDRCADEPEDRDEFQDDDGCPDPDNDEDGVLDVNDGAPMDPEDRDQFEDEDGVPDPDNDQDRIPDTSDGAPNDPEDYDTFADTDGIPDPDNDGDTVLDPDDECPLAPGPVETRGCPRTVRLDTETGQIVILQRVEFATNRDVVLPRSFPILQDVQAILRANPQIERLRIEGHTDDRGRDDRNLDLSRRRARSVMQWLMDNGIAQDRLEAWGCGELHPLGENRTASGRQTNRRVEFLLIRPAPPAGLAPREGCVQAE